MEKIIIITNSNRHEPTDSIFPISHHLIKALGQKKVYVVDRADEQNTSLFSESEELAFYGREIDIHYHMNTSDYPLVNIPQNEISTIWFRIDRRSISEDNLSRLGEALPNTTFINKPQGIIKAGSKDYLQTLPPILGSFMPSVRMCQTPTDVEKFKLEFPNIVLKGIKSSGGKDVFRYNATGKTDIKTPKDIANLFKDGNTFLAMEYLDPPTRQSDNRILVMNGKVLGGIKRVAAEDGWICNISAGGTFSPVEPSDVEREIVALIDPELSKLGVHLYGIDTLLDAKGNRVLSEINALNVGCFAELEEATGEAITKTVADEIIKLHLG